MNERQTDGPPEDESQSPPEQQPDAPSEQSAQNAPEQQPEPASERQSSEAAPGPAEKAGTRVGRVLFWCAVAVLLVLAFLDYRTKTAAQKTGNDLRRALRQKAIGTDLKESEIKKYLQGEPTHQRLEKVPDEMLDKLPKDLRLLVSSAAVYTWKGIFREYKVTVFFSLGADPPVEAVEGPGQAPAQKKAPPKKEKEKE